jgi:hypothetical protein
MPTIDPSFRYVWLIWASLFLLPWTALFVAWPALRRPMLWASALTAPFGLTEPLFVPAYWNPPSLFDLAHRTGFDIESLIFCFAIGGLAAARATGYWRRPRNMHSHLKLATPDRWWGARCSFGK